VGTASGTILSVRNDGLVEVNSTTQGFLPPRMTTSQREQISNPAVGSIIYNTTTNCLETKTSSGWIAIRTIDYPSVLIGAQYWMEKNLDVTTYNNGDVIPYVPDATAWGNLTSGAWCYYNNDPSSGYGKLYNWYAAADVRGLCPAGWHVPTDAEWAALETSLGGASIAGGKLKVAGVSRWASPNIGATNSSYFSALPGGLRQSSGTTFGSLGNVGYWWSATQSGVSVTSGWSRSLYFDAADISGNEYSKKSGFSVRCLRD